MSQRKSYTTKRTPLVFDIDGEEFEAFRVPGALFIDFTRQMSSATEEQAANLMYDAFSACMEEHEFERFWKRCRTDVDIELLQQIFADLASGMADRPTVPSSPSARGRRRGAAAAGSSGRASKLGGSTSGNSAT